jgi:predicted SprT family Zn-dependent metalloprotease
MSSQISLFEELDPADESAWLQTLYDRLAARFALDPARVVLSRRKLAGGHILFGPPHRITLSSHTSRQDRLETLLHEAAHAWCFRHGGGAAEGHSARFWKMAAAFGARRRHAPETEALRQYRRQREVVYRCEGCRALFRRMRAFGRTMVCARCADGGRPARLRRLRRRQSGRGSA